MQRWRIPLFACLGVTLAVALAFVLASISPTVVKAAPPSRGPQPFMATVTCTISSGANCQASIPAIEAGKRLVIEHVSVSTAGTNPGVWASLHVSLGGWGFYVPLPLRSQSTYGSALLSVMADELLAFAEGSDNYVFFHSDAGGGTVSGTVSGYVEDAQ